MPARREFLMLGGGALVTLGLPRMSGAAQVETVQMKGTVRGERVWFAPTGLAVSRGSTVRFTNLDPANSHTATVYHPDLFGRHLRIPADAEPWDSGFLLPEESFEVTLTVPGVYGRPRPRRTTISRRRFRPDFRRSRISSHGVGS